MRSHRVLLGLVACLLGCDSEAARAQLSDVRGPDSLTAQVERAVQAWQRGDKQRPARRPSRRHGSPRV